MDKVFRLMIFGFCMYLFACNPVSQSDELENPYRWVYSTKFRPYVNPIYHDGVYYGFPYDFEEGILYFVGIEELTGDTLFVHDLGSHYGNPSKNYPVFLEDEDLYMSTGKYLLRFHLRTGAILNIDTFPESMWEFRRTKDYFSASGSSGNRFYEFVKNDKGYEARLIHYQPKPPNKRFVKGLAPVKSDSGWYIATYEMDFSKKLDFYIIEVNNDAVYYHDLEPLDHELTDIVHDDERHIYFYTVRELVAINKLDLSIKWKIFKHSSNAQIVGNRIYTLSFAEIAHTEGIVVVDIPQGTFKRIPSGPTRSKFQMRDEFLFCIQSGDLKVLDTKKDKWLITPESLQPRWAWVPTFGVGDHSVLLIDEDGWHCRPYRL